MRDHIGDLREEIGRCIEASLGCAHHDSRLENDDAARLLVGQVSVGGGGDNTGEADAPAGVGFKQCGWGGRR
jgi:hypothetical protein